MLDGNALPQPHNPSSGRTLPGRAIFSPQALQAVLIVLGIALATFVLYLYVLPNSQMDAAKVRIAELQAQKARLERENAAVLQQIAAASNLKTIEVRAKALGMGPTKNVIYLRMPGSVPSQAASAAERTTGRTTPEGPSSLADWLRSIPLQETLRAVRADVIQAVDRVMQRFHAD